MQRRATRYIDEVVQRRKRQVLLTGVLVLILLGFCYLFVWQRVYTFHLAEEHSARKQSVTQLKERCRALEYEINQLSSLKRIEDVARRDLALLPLREIELENLAAANRKTAMPQSTNVAKSLVKPGKSANAVAVKAGSKSSAKPALVAVKSASRPNTRPISNSAKSLTQIAGDRGKAHN